MRAIKYGLIVLAALIVGAGVALTSMDFGAYKGYAIDAAREATGRELAIDGPVHLSLFPAPSLVAEKVRFANAKWGSTPDMVTVEKVEARVSLMPLFSGDVVVERLVLVAPDILLETGTDGRGNWEFEAPQPGGKDAGGGAGKPGDAPILNDVTIERGKLVSRDGTTGRKTTLALDRLHVTGAGAGVPLKVELTGNYNDHPIEAKGTLGAIADLDAPRPWPVDIAAKAGGAEATAKGSIAKPMEAKGVDLALAVEGKDLTALSKLVGSDLPALGAYKLAANVSGPATEGWLVKGLHAELGKTRLSGEGAIALDRTPMKVTAKLDTPELDLAALGDATGKSAGAATGGPSSRISGDGRIFDAAPLPLDALKSIDADVTLAAKRIVRDQLALTDASVRLVVQRGRLVIQPLKAVHGMPELIEYACTENNRDVQHLITTKPAADR